MVSTLFRDPQARSSALAALGTPQPRAFGSLNRVETLDSTSNYYVVLIKYCFLLEFPSHTHSPISRGLIMGIWNSHTSVGNILGTIIPSFWADCDNDYDPWGWSFIVPSFIMVIVAMAIFLFLVNGRCISTTVEPLYSGHPKMS